MTYLVLGVLLWSFLHLMPAAQLSIRSSLIKRTDMVVYKGLFALLIVVSIVLMVIGWKAAPRQLLFVPPSWATSLNLVLMFLASILFLGPYIKSNVRRFMRHPQLTGLVLWSIGHILATGQLRSLVLFGGLGAWAIIEMLLLNRRDGAYEKPEQVSGKADFQLLVAGLMVFGIFMYTHTWLFGVTAVPNW